MSAFENRLRKLERHIALMQTDNKALPFERGLTMFADHTPDGTMDHMVDRLWIMDGKTFRVAKNGFETATLVAGEEYEYGIVDSRLRRPVRPGDIFWLEVK